ncbi:MAG: heme-binding domain-containing protein [Chitinophagaceae bacterium]|nr:heme-binding domain-containing protein [Chitinophagaceae bacterium]
MRLFKKILLALFVVFIGIQFIRPARNISGRVSPTDITKTVNVPDSVANIFKSSCYDCHSNNTRYPWYVNIQPLGWIMDRHVNTGKENLNLNEFTTYSKRKQANKLKAIANSIRDGSMPLASYTILHHDAKLRQYQKDLVIQWAMNAKDTIEMEK